MSTMQSIGRLVHDLKKKNEALESELKHAKQKLQFANTRIFDLRSSKRLLQAKLAEQQPRGLQRQA